MHRSIVIASIASLGLAAPLAAQGHSGKQTRTYVDARGRQCRETTHLKGNGDEKYEVKCKSAKGHKGYKHGGDDDDDDDDGRYGNGSYGDRRQGDGRYGNGGNCFDSRNPSCDVVQGRSYPTSLPDMASAVIWGRGQRTTTATRWLGGNDYRVRYVDRDGDGRPEAASWFTSGGTMIQQWIDSNRDGRADAVRIYRDGRLVRQLGS
jgi:hypothetical protein